MKGMIRTLLRRLIGLPDLVYYTSVGGSLVGKPEQIGAFTIIDYSGGVKIGKNVKIGYGVVILSSSTITGNRNEKLIKKPVVIEDDVEIGTHAVILPGVRIGRNTTIGAGAVVTHTIPPNVVAVGVPAKVVKAKTKK